MKQTRLAAHWLILAVSIAMGLTAPYSIDFRTFYDAGRALLQGLNPYTLPDFFNPLHIAALFAPMSVLPFEVAWRINAGVMFGAYLLAMSRLFKRPMFWLAMTAPFGLLIAYTGNLDALVLLGVTLPAPIGVWLLLAKPHIGLFAAAIMLWNYRSWKLAAAVGGVLIGSVALGMIHGGLNIGASMSLWPYGLIVGLPLLWLAWRRRDSVIAMGAAAFISPYLMILSWSAALPLFRATTRRTLIGVALSWLVFVVLSLHHG